MTKDPEGDPYKPNCVFIDDRTARIWCEHCRDHFPVDHYEDATDGSQEWHHKAGAAFGPIGARMADGGDMIVNDEEREQWIQLGVDRGWVLRAAEFGWDGITMVPHLIVQTAAVRRLHRLGNMEGSR